MDGEAGVGAGGVGDAEPSAVGAAELGSAAREGWGHWAGHRHCKHTRGHTQEGREQDGSPALCSPQKMFSIPSPGVLQPLDPDKETERDRNCRMTPIKNVGVFSPIPRCSGSDFRVSGKKKYFL